MESFKIVGKASKESFTLWEVEDQQIQQLVATQPTLSGDRWVQLMHFTGGPQMPYKMFPAREGGSGKRTEYLKNTC